MHTPVEILNLKATTKVLLYKSVQTSVKTENEDCCPPEQLLLCKGSILANPAVAGTTHRSFPLLLMAGSHLCS